MNDLIQSPIASGSVKWPVGAVEENEEGFLLRPKKLMDTLPIEFWNHELKELNLANDDELRQFVITWGFPYHPFRNSTDTQKTESGIRETDRYFRQYIPIQKEGLIDKTGFFAPESGSPALFYISKTETIAAIRYLQLFIEKAVYGLHGYIDESAMHVINRAASNEAPLMLSGLIMDGEGSGLPARGMLTSAICNQLLASFADEANWKLCKCDGCGRIFKRKQSTRRAEGSGQTDKDAMYCCDKCKERQVKRNQRKSAKNRIQH